MFLRMLICKSKISFSHFITPESGISNKLIHLSNVDFPDPEEPKFYKKNGDGISEF